MNHWDQKEYESLNFTKWLCYLLLVQKYEATSCVQKGHESKHSYRLTLESFIWFIKTMTLLISAIQILHVTQVKWLIISLIQWFVVHWLNCSFSAVTKMPDLTDVPCFSRFHYRSVSRTVLRDIWHNKKAVVTVGEPISRCLMTVVSWNAPLAEPTNSQR